MKLGRLEEGKRQTQIPLLLRRLAVPILHNLLSFACREALDARTASFKQDGRVRMSGRYQLPDMRLFIRYELDKKEQIRFSAVPAITIHFR